MQCFIKLQNILNDPKKTFPEFRQQLINSEITQFTYLCLLLNIAATIKRQNFQFEPYLNLISNFKNQSGYRSACVNYTGYKDKISILMNACQKSLYSTVKSLVTHPDIKLHIVDPYGFNAIYYAIRNLDQWEGLRILQLLHQLCPQIINTVTNNGYSPLFLAVQRLNLKAMQFLLRNGTNPNQQLISSGNTALHELMKMGSLYRCEEIRKIVQIFVRQNFDLKLRNNEQKTIQDYGLQYGFLNISEIIKQVSVNHHSSQPQCQQFNDEWSEIELFSSKMATTKIGDLDLFTSYNYSEIQRSQFNNEIDCISVSNQSLLSQEINHFKYEEQRELSLNIDHDQNYIRQDELIGFDSLNHQQKHTECLSHADLLQCAHSLSQNQLIPHSNNIFKNTITLNPPQNEHPNLQIDTSFSSSSSDQSETTFLNTQSIDFIKIHHQIAQFDQISQQIYFSAWKQIEPFFFKLAQIISDLFLSIEVIGSFATGLWTYHSDIDIALIPENQGYVHFQRLLDKVYGKIKNKTYQMGIKSINYNKNSKIPSLKIQMDPYLFSSRKIDLMIFHRKNAGITYVNYIREALTIYPQIRPLFFFLKRTCEQFGLLDPFNGGMKSYSIFLLINSIIRSLELTNLGEILLKISLYFGFYHTYDYEIQFHQNIINHQNLQQTKQTEYFVVERLNIKDPLNTKNNMGGRNTDVLKLKNMFRTIYYAIHKTHNDQTTLQNILEMATVIN